MKVTGSIYQIKDDSIFEVIPDEAISCEFSDLAISRGVLALGDTEYRVALTLFSDKNSEALYKRIKQILIPIDNINHPYPPINFFVFDAKIEFEANEEYIFFKNVESVIDKTDRTISGLYSYFRDSDYIMVDNIIYQIRELKVGENIRMYVQVHPISRLEFFNKSVDFCKRGGHAI